MEVGFFRVIAMLYYITRTAKSNMLDMIWIIVKLGATSSVTKRLWSIPARSRLNYSVASPLVCAITTMLFEIPFWR